MDTESGTIIVTGGLGFIGKNFAHQASTQFKEKIILDKFTYASDLDFYYSVLRPLGWKLTVGDVKHVSTSLNNVKCSSNVLIVNFAAESHVDRSFKNAKQFLDANAFGTLSLLDFCRDYGHKLLHISTDEVYGEITGVGVSEDALLNPTNPYSASKAAADLLVQTYITCFGVDAKIIRANNIFGNRQYFEKVIPKAMYRASKSMPFEVHGAKNLRRHFLHTSDFYAAIMKILISWFDSDERIFNIRADSVIGIHQLVEHIYNFYEADLDLISTGKDRPFNDSEYQVDDKKLRNLGWEPKVDFWSALDTLCSDNDIFCGNEET